MKLSKLFHTLGRRINENEKVLLAILSVIIAISGTFWLREYSSNESSNPSVGGTYVEGIVGDSDFVDTIAARITKVGLFHFNSQGVMENVLVDSWSVNADKTEYKLILKTEIDAEEIKQDIEANFEVFGNIEAQLNGNELVLKSPQSNPNIPLILAQPLFDYGPYKLNKKTDETTIFTRSNREGSQNSYINKIIVHRYENNEDLQQAINRKKVDGVSVNNDLDLPENFQLQEIKLPQYYALIFNLNRAPFKSNAVRQQAINFNFSGRVEFTLTVADQEEQLALADKVVQEWTKKGAVVKINKKSVEEIQSNIGPSRDFQVMLTGINYGYEIDPFYLWHASQILPPGNNLSGINNIEIDKQLEKIRNIYNITERDAEIDKLHKALQAEGALKVLSRKVEQFAHSDGIRFVKPSVGISSIDHWYSLREWSSK